MELTAFTAFPLITDWSMVQVRPGPPLKRIYDYTCVLLLIGSRFEPSNF